MNIFTALRHTILVACLVLPLTSFGQKWAATPRVVVGELEATMMEWSAPISGDSNVFRQGRHYCNFFTNEEIGWRLPRPAELLLVNPWQHPKLVQPPPPSGNKKSEAYRETVSKIWMRSKEVANDMDVAARLEGGRIVYERLDDSVLHHVMCVRKVKPGSAPTVAKSVVQSPLVVKLTTDPELPKVSGPTPEQTASWKAIERERSADEARIAREHAEASRRGAELAMNQYQYCMKPESRGLCSCLRYYPKTQGNSCGK